MNEHLELLDILLDYIEEQGEYNHFLKWAEMYGYNKKDLDQRLERRYNHLE